MFGRNLHHVVEAKLIEVGHAQSRPAVVCLVDGDDGWRIGFADDLCDFLITGDQPLTAIYNEHKQIRVSDSAAPSFEHQVVQRIFARPEHAAGVDQFELTTQPFRGMRDHVACCTWDFGHDGASPTRQTVEKGRFPHVRAADQHHR